MLPLALSESLIPNLPLRLWLLPPPLLQFVHVRQIQGSTPTPTNQHTETGRAKTHLFSRSLFRSFARWLAQRFMLEIHGKILDFLSLFVSSLPTATLYFLLSLCRHLDISSPPNQHQPRPPTVSKLNHNNQTTTTTNISDANISISLYLSLSH